MNERLEGGVWILDPDASLESLLNEPSCPPPVRRALSGVHSWQARNETTVERALRASQLMPQWTAALLALGATVTVDGGEGPEEVPLHALVLGEIKGEVTAVRVPIPNANIRWGEAHVARTPSDDSIVAAFGVLRMSGDTVETARLALTGVWSGVVRLAEAADVLVGASLNEGRIEDVVAAVRREVDPVGDYLGSERYRRTMAGVMTRRALEACLEEEVTGE